MESILLRVERTLVRFTCGVKLRNKKRTSELTSTLELSEDL